MPSTGMGASISARCYYAGKDASEQYLAFMPKSKAMADALRGKVDIGGVTLLKVIDEYNYAKFTN